MTTLTEQLKIWQGVYAGSAIDTDQIIKNAEALEAERENLAALVRQLIRLVKRTAPVNADTAAANRAQDYLERIGMSGSILRSTNPSKGTHEQAQEAQAHHDQVRRDARTEPQELRCPGRRHDQAQAEGVRLSMSPMSTQIFRLINDAEAELCRGVRASYWQPIIDAARRENKNNEKLGQAFDDQSRELEIACEVMTPAQLTEFRHRAYPTLYPRP